MFITEVDNPPEWLVSELKRFVCKHFEESSRFKKARSVNGVER